LFIPAFSLLALDLTGFTFPVSLTLLTIGYTAFAGFYQESVDNYDKTILGSLANFYVGNKKDSKKKFTTLLSLVFILSITSTFILLLYNLGSISTTQTSLYILYSSLIIANTFLISRILAFPFLVLLEVDFSKAMDMGASEYLKENSS
jgi:hypothetical protein